MLHECKFVLLYCDILCFDLNVAKLQFGFAHVSTGPRGGWVPRAWASKWIPLSRLENCQWTKLCSDNKPWLASPAALLYSCSCKGLRYQLDLPRTHTHTHTEGWERRRLPTRAASWGHARNQYAMTMQLPIVSHSLPLSPSISSSSFRFISFRYCPIYSLQSSPLPLGPSCCFGCLCCCLISLLGLFVCRLPGDSLLGCFSGWDWSWDRLGLPDEISFDLAF